MLRKGSLFLSIWGREHQKKTGDPATRRKGPSLSEVAVPSGGAADEDNNDDNDDGDDDDTVLVSEISTVRRLIDETLGSGAWRENRRIRLEECHSAEFLALYVVNTDDINTH